MKIKVPSTELNRIMKTVVQCISPKDMKLGNIQLTYDNNLLTINGTNGSFSAMMSTPLLGGDGESFCVDGTLFARVCAMCSGDIEISTDEKNCTIKGNGRTRMPIVKVTVPEYKRVTGTHSDISAQDFNQCYNAVSYAVSTDQARPVLTGILVEASDAELRMVALDGFQMALATTKCKEGNFKVVIPGAFMKLISQSIFPNDIVKLTVGKGKVQAETDGMLISCGLLMEEFPDYNRIFPTEFKTECLVNVDALRNALKSGSVVNTQNNLIRMDIGADKMVLMSNSEEADYQAEIECRVLGDGLAIAFNQKYLMNTINSVSADNAMFKFNSPVSPCVIGGQMENSIHLLLPVRTR